MKKGNGNKRKQVRVDTIKRGNRYKDGYSKNDIVKIADDMLKFFYENRDKYQIISYTNIANNVHRSTLYDWLQKKKVPYLNDAFARIKDICIERMIEKGITGNKAMALIIFLLKNISPEDYKDKFENNVTVTDLSQITKDFDKVLGA